MPRITITEPGKKAQPYRLKTERELTKIGRGSDNDIILESGSASSYHCEMIRVKGGFVLRDKDSTNGIKLDDTRYQVIDLLDDLTVFIGDDIELHFELGEEEIEILSGENFQSRQKIAFPKSPVVAPEPEEEAEEEQSDEEEYEEVTPPRKKKKSKKSQKSDDEPKQERKKRSDNTPRESKGIGSAIIFGIIAVLLVIAGLCFRHYQEHGTFLFDK